MTTCLERAKEFLQTQSPTEYLKQLSVASHALARARGDAKGPGVEAGTELEELRRLMEPGD